MVLNGVCTLKNYLCIKNVGVCDYRLFTLLGASTARGEESKIGQFGSGAKHGALVLLRQGITPVVMLGKDELTYYTVDIELQGKPQKQLGVSFRGEKALQSMVLDFGAMDWQNPHMALREYISNAIDAGGWEVTLQDTVEGVDGETRVYVPLNADILEYYNNLSRYFLHVAGLEECREISNITSEKCRVYRKGVLVGELRQPSVFHYNLPDVPLDESRNIKTYEAAYAICRHIVDDMDASKFCRALVHGPEDCFERNMTIGTRFFTDARATALRAAWPKQYVLGCNSYTKHLNHLAESRNLSIVSVGSSCFSLLKMVLPSLESITTSVVNGVITEPLAGNLAETWNSLWSWLLVNGVIGNQTSRPQAMMFKDPTMMGFSSNGILYFNEKAGISHMVYALECAGNPDLRNTMLDALFANQGSCSEL